MKAVKYSKWGLWCLTLTLVFFTSCSVLDEFIELGEKEIEEAKKGKDGEDGQKDKDKDKKEKDITEYTKKELENIKISTQTGYQNERAGAPARPTWIDTFRHYPELDFFGKGRYLLGWRKDPGDNAAAIATRFELFQITFRDPGKMAEDDKWGRLIQPDDIKDAVLIATTTNPVVVSTTGDVTLPADLIPADKYSTESSTSYPPRKFNLVLDSQYGYYAVKPGNAEYVGRQRVVAYKVRAYSKILATDDLGNDVMKEMYNDSPVVIVDYKAKRYAQVAGVQQLHEGMPGIKGTKGSPTGGGSPKHVPDTMTSLQDVRDKLGIPSSANFLGPWENRKLTGAAPIESLITESDFDALFPPNLRKTFHDLGGDYYTWENFVEASRYFPKFLGEGTTEDKYRELAAFLGNKSHETGDGWADLGSDRWKYGLVWIVELDALSNAGLSRQPTDRDVLYRAYFPHYEVAHNSYSPVKGKSYHGRGPVQLSWNYNYGMMSENMFGDPSILLENPDLVAREGLLGFASAIWFWMQPQRPKPSAHDVMVGNVKLTTPYTAPTDGDKGTARRHLSTSAGHDAAGNPVSYKDWRIPRGVEIGFGLTINIINGGLESNVPTDNRQARRIVFFSRYLDYFGRNKLGLSKALSPRVTDNDPVPAGIEDIMSQWATWRYVPADYNTGPENFPVGSFPSIITSRHMSSF
ncbi:chitinase [Candidatus Haliotispira prima]|uniref:Chitinase n=1 Tax=Candidatus Haliotispira prima TaxID=3034016 RepID=A0ABY8MH40_9SPIO|nr:chitinase [Candidatus Haliotispira prima]